MDTSAEQASRVLHELAAHSKATSRLRRLSGHALYPRDPHFEGRIDGALGALVAVGLLSSVEEDRWRRRLTVSPAVPDLAAAGSSVRGMGDAVLGGLLGSARGDPREENPAWDVFEGALDALAAVGAVDRGEWDRRWRAASGRPSFAEEQQAEVRCLNAGGTEQNLLAVIPGPLETVNGARVLYALLFDDGIGLHLWRDADTALGEKDPLEFWDNVELRDDLQTTYLAGSHGGSERRYHVSFRTALPPEANWIEIVFGSEGCLRLAL